MSFSSDSLPHAVSLTVWVRRTDPPRIANMLHGIQLNYAHCGGGDIHNTGIKFLKVTQFLSLQHPAVDKGCLVKLTVSRKTQTNHGTREWGQALWLLAYTGHSDLRKDLRWQIVGQHPALHTSPPQTLRGFILKIEPQSNKHTKHDLYYGAAQPSFRACCNLHMSKMTFLLVCAPE